MAETPPLDPDLVAALRWIALRDRHRQRPLCPQCARHPQSTSDGLCAACSDARRQRELTRKVRWWTKHGEDWRAGRRDITEHPNRQPEDRT